MPSNGRRVNTALDTLKSGNPHKVEFVSRVKNFVFVMFLCVTALQDLRRRRVGTAGSDTTATAEMAPQEVWRKGWRSWRRCVLRSVLCCHCDTINTALKRGLPLTAAPAGTAFRLGLGCQSAPTEQVSEREHLQHPDESEVRGHMSRRLFTSCCEKLGAAASCGHIHVRFGFCTTKVVQNFHFMNFYHLFLF